MFISADDARVDVEGIDFRDLTWDGTPAFIRAVLDGDAWAEGHRFPSGWSPVVRLPDGITHKERIARGLSLCPAGRIRAGPVPPGPARHVQPSVGAAACGPPASMRSTTRAVARPSPGSQKSLMN